MTTPITATYRLQLRADAFTLGDARNIAEYLQQLGVSHVYLSPVLTAAHGSTHGYDVTDPTTVSAALGGPAGLRALADELRSRAMGLVIDIVPNHVGVSDPRQNAWWWDVLKHGLDSPYAPFFDIDWRTDNGAGGRIALPVFDGENDVAALRIDRTEPEPMLAFGDLRFPIKPGTDEGNALAVHDRQSYRLANWRCGAATYRRFFTVNSLAALRQEDPRVFDATHSQVAAWAAHDVIDGLRIDHPDGMADPTAYLLRLRQLVGPTRWIVIEKILGATEPLDATLPVDGTTGYEALAELGGVFVDRAGARGLAELSTEIAGTPGDADWLELAETEVKRQVATTDLAPEVRRLVAAIARDALSAHDHDALAEAVVEVLVSLRVYRPDYAPLAGSLTRAVAATVEANPSLAEALSVVGTGLAAGGEAAVRFSQVCGALTAKSVEDCLFYRAARLVSLQEVGGDPARFGHTPLEFHMANAERARRWPRTMTTLSTHDTKRGEDVRARIGVLSQVPALWTQHVLEWERLTPSPDGITGLFLLQNMFGVWPADGTPAASVPDLRDRLHAYAEKAIREAGLRTTWNKVDEDFEKACHTWIDAVIDGLVGESMSTLVGRLAPHGWSDSLGQKLLQLCGPGIPDVYQGTELWEDSLVDPDNRRVVDFSVRQRMLATLNSPPSVDSTGAAKLWVVAHALWLRRQKPECFVGGTYSPVTASGDAADHLIGFVRGSSVLALATRHSVALADKGWGTTVLELPPGSWVDRLTDAVFAGTVPLSEVFRRLPVALLART